MTATQQILQIPGIGPVTFITSARAKRIIISVRPRRGVRVSLPPRNTLKAALEFVETKKKWINKHLEKIHEYEQKKEDAGRAFEQIDKKEAKKQIKRRLKELARQNGFTYGKVMLRNQHTRWGSCSGKNNISLNLKLAVLPPDLADYVLFHELVHTKIHDHSAGFWRELDKYVGDGKAQARRLTEYGLGIL